MSKILLSIKKIHSDKIYEKTKKVEIRKFLPEKPFKKVYLYETSPVKKVTGFFTVKKIKKINKNEKNYALKKYLRKDQIKLARKYLVNYDEFYFIFIDSVRKFKEPKTLKYFRMRIAPYSFRYLK